MGLAGILAHRAGDGGAQGLCLQLALLAGHREFSCLLRAFRAGHAGRTDAAIAGAAGAGVDAFHLAADQATRQDLIAGSVVAGAIYHY